MPKLTVPHKLEPFLTKRKRFKIAYGGRGGTKSQTFADLLLFLAQTQNHKVGCFREMQNSIEDSVYSLLKDEITRMELEGFTVQNNNIFHRDGGEFRFKGLARNPDAIKSMHGFSRFWVEEAQSISEESLRKLTPTLRTDDSEIWFSLNPQSSEDPISRRFLKPFERALVRDGYYEDDLHLIIKVNYLDNPWFPITLERERQWDYENISRAEYNHIWLGDYNDYVENALIPAEWFDAAVDAHEKLGFEPRGAKVAAHDPSDSGDARGYALRHGSVILDVRENTRDDVNDACDWAMDLAINANADLFVWDGDGLGVTLKRQIGESLKDKKIDYLMYRGSSKVEHPKRYYEPIGREDSDQKKQNKDTFKNKRAQYHVKLRDRFHNAYLAVEKDQYIDPDEMISISSKIECLDKLRSEICRIPLKPNGAGLIQIMSKIEMKNKYNILSPNVGESVMMTLAEKAKDNDFMQPLHAERKYVV